MQGFIIGVFKDDSQFNVASASIMWLCPFEGGEQFALLLLFHGLITSNKWPGTSCSPAESNGNADRTLSQQSDESTSS